MPVIYSQTVTVLRAPRLRDDSGVLTTQSDWDNAVPHDLVGVSVQPVETSETRDAAGILIFDQWRLIGPRGARLDVTIGDRVMWDGRTLDVIGNPQFWPDLLRPGGVHHTECVLKASPPTRLTASGAGAVLNDGLLGGIGSAGEPWTP